MDAGFSLWALARNVDKLSFAEVSAVTAIQGDATSIDDVERLIDGADVVVSCVGNPNKETHIMEATANNVLEAAGVKPERPVASSPRASEPGTARGWPARSPAPRRGEDE